MSSSSDLKEALSQRLKKMEANGPFGQGLTTIKMQPIGSSSNSQFSAYQKVGHTAGFSGGGNIQHGRSVGTGLPPGSSFGRDKSPKTFPVDADIRCEGYLSKFSSGSLTGRWQKRYFVLKDGRFGYFRRAPALADEKPEKSFSLRKIKEVISKESVNEREFSIRVGETLYPLKAPTPSDARKWASVITTALAHKDSIPMSEEDEDGSSSAVDMISLSNSVTSQISDVSMMNEDVQAYISLQRAMAASSARQHETVWEVDLDPDELEVLFAEWFPSFEDTTEQVVVLGELMTKALTKSISHLYATLSGDIFDTGLIDLAGQYKRAKSLMQTVRKESSSSQGSDPVGSQLNSVLIEYISRIINQVSKFLDHRREVRESSRDGEDDASGILWKRSELIGILNTLSHLISDLSSLHGTADCGCSYCDPPGFLAGETDNCAAADRWKKSLRNCLQRVGGELELSLIERIQAQMLPIESTWDASAGSSETAPCKKNHSLFGSRLTVWLTGWAPALLLACQQEGSDLLKQTSILSHCARLVSEIVSSVLVAVLNSAWRQFKRKCLRTNALASKRKEALKTISELRANNVGFWSVFSSGTTLANITQLDQIPPDETNTLAFYNLLAFANEAVMLSVYLTETLPQQLPYIPKIFESCFDGLSATFGNTAIETCGHVVHFHFIEPNYDPLSAAFNPKILASEIRKTPMIVARDAAEKFASDLLPLGAHPVVKAHVVNMLPASVMYVYLSGLLKNRVKVKVIKNLVSLIESDMIIFKSLFSESRFNCRESAVTKAVDPLNATIMFLTEPKKEIIVTEISKRLLELLGPKYAPLAAVALMEMRGGDFSKQEKLTLLSLVDPTGSLNTQKQSNEDSKQAPSLNDSDAPWRF